VRTYEAAAVEHAGRGTIKFLAMEFVHGQTLRELLREIGPFPEPLVLLLARQAAAALSAVHDAGIVHRDIKPENLLVTADHRLKVMDLGVARIHEASLRLSHTGEFLGSLPYAAPEQFEGDRTVDGRADMYSLGVVLYELLTGRNPFAAADPFASIRRHMDLVPDKPGMVNPQISHLLEELVMTCLEKNAASRFQDAVALQEALDQGAASQWWLARHTVAMKGGADSMVRRVRIPRETPVFGREADLESLLSSYRAAAEGNGRVAIIMGEAGIGKTRLMDELAAKPESEGEPFQFLYGSTPPEGAVRPLQPFSEALLDRLGEENLEQSLEGPLSNTPVLIPAFAAFLRGAPPPSGAEPLTRDSVLSVAADALRSLAGNRPTILVIDDLHFADEETRRLFAYLARAAADLNLLLIGTARPDPTLAELFSGIERDTSVNRLNISRLGARETVALLREFFGSQKMVDEVGLRILEKADGNPFFIFEIVRGLKERGAITPQPDGTYAARLAVTEVDVPSTVKDLLMLRLAELDEDDMDILHAAAVQGFEFDPEAVAEALQIDRLPLLKRLGRLERRHRLVRHVGYRYRFDHHLVREMVYEDLAPSLREEYHRLVAEALRGRAVAPEVVASHFFRSSRPEEGLGDLLSGVSRLKSAFQNEKGLALCSQGLEALPDDGDEQLEATRFEVLIHKAAFLDRLGIRDRQEAALNEARQVADRLGGPERAIRISESFAWMYANTGRFEDARRSAEEALRAAHEAGDIQGETRASKALGTVAWNLGRLDDARSLWDRALHLAQELGDRKEEADVLNNLGTVAQNTGDYEGARSSHESALAIRREIADRYGEAQSLSNLGIVAYHLGRYEEAREFHERALRIRREVGDRQGESNSLNNLGAVAHYLGEYDDARRFHEESLQIKRQSGDRAGEATSLNNLGNVAYALEDLETAERMHSRAVEIRKEIGDVRGQAYSVSNLGLVLQDLGRLGQARRLHEEALTLNRQVGDPAGAAIALSCLGGLATERGDFEVADALLEESLQACRKVSDTRGESYALAALAELARQRGDLAGARTTLEKSLELRRSISYTHGVMTACMDLGDLLAETGEKQEAARMLREAMKLAHDLGRRSYELISKARLDLLEGRTVDAQTPKGLAPMEEVELRWAILRNARERGDDETAAQEESSLRALLTSVCDSLEEDEREAFWTRVHPNREIGPG
jgi:tetratricopeptide (TPR) repeat protein